jgi:hypothetical protein
VHAGLIGIAGFVLLAAAGAVILNADWPLRGLARAVQSLHNHVFARHRQPLTGLDKLFLADRDSIREVLGRQWRHALLLTTGRIGFDFGCLLGALHATGAHPQPSLALLAYATANIVALIPLTPGGLRPTNLDHIFILFDHRGPSTGPRPLVEFSSATTRVSRLTWRLGAASPVTDRGDASGTRRTGRRQTQGCPTDYSWCKSGTLSDAGVRELARQSLADGADPLRAGPPAP